MKNIVVLTGAGISAESGIKTFRDADGLWEGHDVMEVATPEGFENNPELVLEFYNQRRKQLKEVNPNEAHLNLVALEEHYHVDIVTQNVDDLHERAGSTNVLHLHGELRKIRSTGDEHLIYPLEGDLKLGDLCEKGMQLRPHIVWFGEAVPMLDKAIQITEQADVLIIIGTSMQVYPAASLINFVRKATPIYFIDPKPAILEKSYTYLTIIEENAVIGTKQLLKRLTD
ncbi:MAG: NAD-dependent deacylase [Flavobacteriaceae bacterium]|nr:NAD-dependent deacylase [Flavobacteriaceae bacterium]